MFFYILICVSFLTIGVSGLYKIENGIDKPMSYPITPLIGACTVMRIFKDLGIQK